MAKKNSRFNWSKNSDAAKDETENIEQTESAQEDLEIQNESRELSKKNKDKIALLISLLVVGALAFFTYRYFNNQTFTITNRLEELREETSDIISSNTQREEEEAQEGTTPTQGEQTEYETSTGTELAPPSGQQDTTFGQLDQWRATDYQQGDVQTGSYAVQNGDTLWELAEGAYGDGSQWTRILDANADLIGFLPGGQQALIFPGQVLVIPAI